MHFLFQKIGWFVSGLFLWLPLYSFSQTPSNNSLSPNRHLSQFMVESWTTDDGLLSNNILNIYQGKLGYLWVSSYDGLSKFDGVNFKTLDRSNIPQFNTNAVYVVAETADSTLWFGTQGSGLISYKHGSAKAHGGTQYYFQSMFFDSKGAFWVGTRGNGAFTIRNDKEVFKPVEYSVLKTVSVNFIGEDKSGAIWFGTEGQGLVRFQNNEFSSLGTEQGLENLNVNHILFQDNGKMLVSTYGGLFQYDGSKFSRIKELGTQRIDEVLTDEHGSLWIAGWEGLYRWNPYFNIYEKLNTEYNIINIEDLQFDHENSLWIATKRNGLFRIKDGKFTNYTKRDGLAFESVGSVGAYGKNAFLVGLNNGKINLIENSEVKEFPLTTKLANDRIYDLHQDSKGNLWISTYQGLIKKTPQGTEQLFTTKNGLSSLLVRQVYEDSKGNIWIGTRAGGITIFKTDGSIEYLNQQNGLTSDFIMSIEADKNDNILIGTNNAGLNIISPERKIKVLTLQNGLASNLIFDTHVDEQGIIWVASNGGVSRIEGDNIINYSSKIGLLNDSPFGFLEDNKGGIWMPTSRGVLYVEKQQLNSFAKGQIDRIESYLYSKDDGMKSEQCVGATHSIRDKNGNIIIPTFGGVLVVSPDNLSINPTPPPVNISLLTVDGISMHPEKEKLVFPPKRQRFVFKYSGLSLKAPSKVQFKYKIEPYDDNWVEVGSDRQAVYTGLPPGEYTFTVIASNNDGVWNNIGDSISFEVEPNLYQRLEFQITAALLCLILVFGFFRLRTYQIHKRNKELERTVSERTIEIQDKNNLLEEKNKAIEAQNREINLQKIEIENRNENITSSINYARRIQSSLLPQESEVLRSLREGFIFYKPKDIVSGDFYWASQLKNNTGDDVLVLAIGDCTGHGIPGALLSIVGNDMLNEIIEFQCETNPSKILRELNQRMRKTLNQDQTRNRDGIEIGICTLNLTKQTLQFAGARRPLLVITDGHAEIIKGDSASIAGDLFRQDISYTNHEVKWDPWASYYLFSDGFQDQFGGEMDKKFMSKRFKLLLSQVSARPMTEQKSRIEETLYKWMNPSKEVSYSQVDDILLVGFKVPN